MYSRLEAPLVHMVVMESPLLMIVSCVEFNHGHDTCHYVSKPLIYGTLPHVPCQNLGMAMVPYQFYGTIPIRVKYWQKI